MTWKKNLNILRTPDPVNLKKQLMWVESLGQAHPNPIYSPPNAKEGMFGDVFSCQSQSLQQIGKFLAKRKVAHPPAYVFWFVCVK